MTQPTNLIHPHALSVDGDDVDRIAKLELEPDVNTFLPGEYVYLLAHIPKGAKVIEPCYCSDLGNIQLLGKTTQRREQSGLVLNNKTRTIILEYQPAALPEVIFFGAEIELAVSRLRSGIIAPVDYDGVQPYKLNVYYDVEFYRIRHLPNHPELVPESDGGVSWEEYFNGTPILDGALLSWPVEYQVKWR